MNILFVTNVYPLPFEPNVNPVVLFQEKGLKRLGVNIDVFVINSKELSLFNIPKLIIQLLKKWQKGQYDLLHVQFGGFQSLLCALVAKDRTVITFHGSDLHGGFPTTMKSKLKSKINVFCSRLATNYARGIIVVSENLVDRIPIKNSHKTKVIPPGVDFDVFSPFSQIKAKLSLNLNPSARYVLFSNISGSPVKRKDFAEIVVKIVQEKFPDVEFLLLTAQPYWRVPLYLNAADCLLLTSENEGSPNIIREAIAVNLPVVSVDVGDVSSQIQGINNCYIVDRDPNLLADAISSVILNGRVANGRKLKQSSISNDLICDEIYNFYQFIIRE